MSEFIHTFQFVLVPFLVMVIFASILPVAGSALYIRNEIMLAIALPPLTGAALTLGVVTGISPENHITLFSFAFVIAFGIVSWLGNLRLSEIKRQIILASLFAGGSVVIHLLMSVSEHAHAHLRFLLTGELLSIDRAELFQSSLLCTAGWFLFAIFRNAVFSYCIDEELMRLRSKRFTVFATFYRISITLIIAASVLYIGPLLTSALLIFPALLSDTGKSSIITFFAFAVTVGLLGAAGGFIAGVAGDIPPAYTASIAILAAGTVLKFVWMFSGSVFTKKSVLISGNK
ncbi:Zinc ABC transporter, inner membrane permease protein ZnuB [Chitinispirillum alkaliphilum]|nr:Zinc ABC transporter, inner membrane permease protein ZnuB [Chitinispirillum alkaliphilum]